MNKMGFFIESHIKSGSKFWRVLSRIKRLAYKIVLWDIQRLPVDIDEMLNLFAFVVLLLAVAAAVFVIVVLGGLPGKIALQRGHHQAEAINICGWAGLITGVFWLIALVWAHTQPPLGTTPTANQPTVRQSTAN